MTYLALMLSLLCSFITINAQSYTPRPLVKTSCSSGQFVTYGNNDVQATTTKTPTTSLPVGQIVATLFNTTEASITMEQLSFGILDNPQITGIVNLRMGIYAVSRTAFRFLGETNEISLYATGATTIYANLRQPVTLPAGSYAVTLWADGLIYTGVNAVVPTTGVALAYSRFGLPPSFTATTNQGSRAVQMVGCADGVDPWAPSPTIQYYSFCLSMLHTEEGVRTATTNTAASTVQVTVNAILAASTEGGTSPQGQYFNVTAGKGSIQNIVMTGATATVPGVVKQLTSTGGSFLRYYNQRIYPNAAQIVDASGFSLQADDGTQYIIQYQDGKYEVLVASPGYTETFQGLTASFSIQLASRDAAYPTCQPTPIRYTPQAFSCPAGTSPVSWGNDLIADMNGALASNLAANILHLNSFTVHVPSSTLYQLSFAVKAQPVNRIQRLRLGLFTTDNLVLTLVGQTNEIIVGGLEVATVLKANLLQPVVVESGKNYSVGVISNAEVATATLFYTPGVAVSGSLYQAIAPSKRGFPSIIQGTGGSTPYYTAAHGCSTQQTTQYSVCAAFLYPTYTQTYSGIITTTTTTQNIATGRYRAVISGSGNATRTSVDSTTTPTVQPFTVRDWNLDTNNYLYEAGNANGMIVDEGGISISVQASTGYGVQLRATWNTVCDCWVYTETQATLYAITYSALEPLVSSFTVTPHTQGSEPPTCGTPPRPANVVQPASVARAACPNPDSDMADVYGEVDGGLFAQHSDGSLIQGNRVYTQQFTADTPATIRQLAVGLLQNADRPEAVRVRLGLYSASSNALLGQTDEITINQAVPQVVIMNLATPVTLTQRETYLIAIQTSQPLEVAHTGVASTPSMAAPFSSTGLPATFASSGNDVSPAIAAHACVAATHSFCGYFQYYTKERTSVSYFYSGLLQAGTTPTTNSYGTYVPVYAAAGKLSAFRKLDQSASQTVTVESFWQQSNTVASLYTSSTNNKALDATGIRVQISNNAESNLQFNLSVNQFDESFPGSTVVTERDLLFSGFSATPLNQGIPECGLASLPLMQQVDVPLPVCPDGNEAISYGNANAFSMTGNNNQGSAGMPGNAISLRSITTDGLQWTKLEQIKIPINVNVNTVHRVRLGVYDSAFRYVGGSGDIPMTNTLNYMVTAVLPQPVYLAPGSTYYLAFWSSSNIWVGFAGGPSVQLMNARLDDPSTPWPSQFISQSSNAERALAGIGCLVDAPPAISSSSSTGTSGPIQPPESSSKSGVESGAVAGIVIGCVIGTNLLLLLLVWACCLRGTNTANKPKRFEDSRVDTSRVEMEQVA